MTDYTQLHENVDAWYDSLNDVHDHMMPDAFGDSHYPRFCQYKYTYLTVISEFSNNDYD